MIAKWYDYLDVCETGYYIDLKDTNKDLIIRTIAHIKVTNNNTFDVAFCDKFYDLWRNRIFTSESSNVIALSLINVKTPYTNKQDQIKYIKDTLNEALLKYDIYVINEDNENFT